MTVLPVLHNSSLVLNPLSAKATRECKVDKINARPDQFITLIWVVAEPTNST